MSGNTDCSRSWGEELYGYADVVDESPMTSLAIFSSSAIHEVRLKLFNLSTYDDRKADFRGAFLKFRDNEGEGPFDLAFYTGDRCPFQDSKTLNDFADAVCERGETLKKWTELDDANLKSLSEGLKKKPTSWNDLEFFSHVTYSAPVPEGTAPSECFVRFRLVGSGDTERSKISDKDLNEELNKANTTESVIDGAMSYLRESIRTIPQCPMTFKLQVQIRKTYSNLPSQEIWTSPRDVWDSSVCPWRDLASIVLTNVVPNTEKERAVYNFDLLPGEVKVITHGKAESHPKLLHMLEKRMTKRCRTEIKENTPKEEVIGRQEKKKTYMVHVETGFDTYAGTDSNVYITMYGTKRRTEKILLDKNFHNDFEKGSREAYYLELDDIGRVKMIKVKLTGWFKDDWHLRNIFVLDIETRQTSDFPCYRWLNKNMDDVTLLTAEASLMNKETDVDVLYQRHLILKEQQAMVQWANDEGIPGRIHYAAYKDIPRDLKFAYSREWEKDMVLYGSAVKLRLKRFVTMFNPFDSFEDFQAMAETLPRSKTRDYIMKDGRWKADEEYGREFISGFNPVLLKRLSQPLDKFPVTDEMVSNLLDRGLSLRDEMKAGHIYFVDYKNLRGIERKGGDDPKFVTNPLVMLYVRTSGQLVPIAIQLEQVPGPENPIWTPNDPALEWLYVKMWARQADTHYHSIYSHFMRAHVVCEAFGVPTYRQLPAKHPVFKLLSPHLKYTMAVNVSGREVLLTGPDSVFQRLLAIPGNEGVFIANMYKEFHIEDVNVVTDLKKRGVDDRDLLPNYWYRDDALLMWSTIIQYVAKVTGVYYFSDDDVKEDQEIQTWARDVRSFGFKNWHGQEDGVPVQIGSIQELNELLTMVIFTASCFHAAVNFGQEDYYSFGPNYPTALRIPPPTKKGGITMELVMQALPRKADQALAIGFAHFLSEFSDNETWLGDYPDPLFVEPGVLNAQDWFRSELKKVSLKIKDRNKSLELPYEYLLPERTPNSVAQ